MKSIKKGQFSLSLFYFYKVTIQNPQRRTWGQARSCGLRRTRCQSPRASF